MRKSLSILVILISLASSAHANPQPAPDDGGLLLDEDGERLATGANVPGPRRPATHWSVLLPGFVIHGTEPGSDIGDYMPRKIDRNGRAVVTPGLGVEYRGPGSLDFLIGFIKDCYDDPAGTVQLGQHFPFARRYDFGYTLGLYVRQTPIICYATTEGAVSSSALPGPGGLLPGLGNRRPPAKVNTLYTTTCGFADNLPFRYTTQFNGTYIDIIPTPFLNFSVALYQGPIDVELKLMSNFYLNEFGVSILF